MQDADGAGLAGLAEVSSINHDPRYHGLHDLSSIIIVLVFSWFGIFVRTILQDEENKGVELTVYPCNGSRAMERGGRVRPVDPGRPCGGGGSFQF